MIRKEQGIELVLLGITYKSPDSLYYYYVECTPSFDLAAELNFIKFPVTNQSFYVLFVFCLDMHRGATMTKQVYQHTSVP